MKIKRGSTEYKNIHSQLRRKRGKASRRNWKENEGILMRTPNSHDHEWWQATIVLGNFDSELEAIDAIAGFQSRDDFVEGHMKGSWH